MRRLQPIATLSALLVMAGAFGCQKDFSVNDKFRPEDLSTDAFAVVDYYDADANIQDATLDSKMTMNPVFKNGRFARHAGYRGGEAGHLGRILRRLGITDDQGAAIKELVKTHRERVKAALEGLRTANQSLIDEVNAKRQEILTAMHNGEITREQAKAQLRELSQSKRESIASNPASAQYIEAICAAKLELFQNIRALLDAAQQAGWDAWVAGLHGMCFDNNK